VTAGHDIAEAVRLHQSGDLAAARVVYEAALADDPDCVDALHFLGLLRHQEGDSEQALQLIGRALELLPGYADAHSNRGNILREMGRLDEARESYERAIACDPDRAEAHNNLGVILRHSGDMQGALQHFFAALALAPESAHTHINLGHAFAGLRYPERALEHYRKAVEKDPRLTDAYRVLGYYLYANDRLDESIAVYEQLERIDPGNPVAAHMLAASTGQAVPDRASDRYVVSLFDAFASRFDDQLARLAYRAPEWIASELAARLPAASGALEVLDAGCGTGLCGPHLRPWAARLTGVDLSPAMLQKARSTGCYDELVRGELVAWLRDAPARYDLIVSADTLVYFGRLDGVLEAAARSLRHGGWLLASVERHERLEGEEQQEGRNGGDPGFRLMPHGRYQHDRGYLEDCVRAAGLELVAIESGVIREEQFEPVDGWLVVARKPGVER
jgi:predicted TPR repeat methyltransferase